MKKTLSFICLLITFSSNAQVNKDELSLKISKAEEANLQALKEYLWKRKSDVSIDGVKKMTTLTGFGFDAQGKLETKVIDADSDVKKKPGLRGNAQENKAEDKMDYIEQALSLAIKYSFMTKGELLDFFDKATVTDKGATLEATADGVIAPGDKLTVVIDAKTYLFTFKKFSGFLGKDPVDGELKYEPFSTGINHGTTTVLNMPAQKMKIEAINQDYSKRVK